MAIWNDSPSLNEVQATQRRAVAKDAMVTRDDERKEDTSAAAKAWEACKKAVDRRDKHRCRACKRKVVATLTRCPERAEHAHLVSRKKESALMHDARNVLLLCHECHSKFDRHKLSVIQVAGSMFHFDGRSLINAEHPLEFK